MDIIKNLEDVKKYDKAIEDILVNSYNLRKEDEGFYFYVDIDKQSNDDDLSNEDIQKILSSKCPRESLISLIDEAYQDYGDEVINTLIKEVVEELNEEYEIEDDYEYIDTYLGQIIMPVYPYKDYEETVVPVNIIVDTGDADYDFSLNTDYAFLNHEIDNKSSMLWLSRTQGINKRGLNKLIDTDTLDGKSPFKKSVYEEMINAVNTMNALTFFVKMDLKDLINLNSKDDEKYALIINKDTTAGLVDYWNGGGSVINISLDRDVLIPSQLIDSINIDGARGCYSVRDIYGIDSSLWSNGSCKIATDKDVNKWFEELDSINPQISIELLK